MSTNTQPPIDTAVDELDEVILDLLSSIDADFGYAVGNLNMDTTKKSRSEIISKVRAWLHQRDEARDNQIRIEAEEDMLHRFTNRLSWEVARGNIDMIHINVETLVSKLTYQGTQLTHPEKGNSNG